MALTVGLIGVGGMGHGIGANLLSNGYRLLVLAHRSRTRVDDLISQGATEKSSAQEMVEEADVVIVCVTGSPQVKDVMFGDGGLIAGVRSGMLVVDCSTGELNVVAEAGEELERRGVNFADAPLARTPVEAAAGKLNTMVGASDAAFVRARQILETFCENIFHMGPVGAANVEHPLGDEVHRILAAAIAAGRPQGLVGELVAAAAERNHVEIGKLGQ